MQSEKPAPNPDSHPYAVPAQVAINEAFVSWVAAQTGSPN